MLAQDMHLPKTVHGAQWEKKGQQHQFGRTGFHVFFFCFGTCAVIKHKGKLIPQAKQLPVKIDISILSYSLAFDLASFLSHFLACYLAYALAFFSGVLFWHPFWHSFWHFFWHFLWHSIWHVLRSSSAHRDPALAVEIQSCGRRRKRRKATLI